MLTVTDRKMGLIKLKLLSETWDKASHDFYKNHKRLSTSLSSKTPALLSLIPDQDDFADHLLSLHRRQCKECLPAGATGQASPDGREAEEKAPLGDRARVETGTQTEFDMIEADECSRRTGLKEPTPSGAYGHLNTPNIKEEVEEDAALTDTSLTARCDTDGDPESDDSDDVMDVDRDDGDHNYAVHSQYQGPLVLLDTVIKRKISRDRNRTRKRKVTTKKQEKRSRKKTTNDGPRRRSLRLKDQGSAGGRSKVGGKNLLQLKVTGSGSGSTTEKEHEEHGSSRYQVAHESMSSRLSPVPLPKFQGRCSSRSSDILPTPQEGDKEQRSLRSQDPSFWSSKLSPVTIPKFEGPCPGPSTPLFQGNEELTFFNLLFPPDLVDHLVFETNRFAERFEAIEGRQWAPTTAEEMKAFLGLQILRSIKKRGDLSVLWTMQYCTSDTIDVWDVMRQDRFEALLKYFQPCGCSAHSEEGPCSQLKAENRCRFLSTLNDCSRSQFDPHQDCTVQETSIKVEGEEEVHLCLLVDSMNGYCNEFRVFHPEQDGKDQHGSRDNVVFDLTQRLNKKHYIVNLSKSYTNLTLLRSLEERGILGRGAVDCSAENTDGLPHLLFSSAVRLNLVFQQGTMIACNWFNPVAKRVVVSTADDPTSICEAYQTFDGIKAMKSLSPTAVVRHMKCMYTNRFNNTHPIKPWSSRRGPCIFWYVLDIAISNATILKQGSACQKKNTKFMFRKQLAKQLIGDFKGGCRVDFDQPPAASDPTLQSNPLSSNGTNANMKHVIPDMVSPTHSSSSTAGGIRISKVTGGGGSMSHPHDDTKDDMSHEHDIESNHLPSVHMYTIKSKQSSWIPGGISMQSNTTHDDPMTFSDHLQSNRAPGSGQLAMMDHGYGMQPNTTSDNLHPKMPDDGIFTQSDIPEDVKPVMPIDGISLQSSEQSCESDDGHPVNANDGVSKQSSINEDRMHSSAQKGNVTTDFDSYLPAKKIKIEPIDEYF